MVKHESIGHFGNGNEVIPWNYFMRKRLQAERLVRRAARGGWRTSERMEKALEAHEVFCRLAGVEAWWGRLEAAGYAEGHAQGWASARDLYRVDHDV